jgi:WD40 repeat protein
VWDLTASRPLGIWPRGEDGAPVRLADGRTVTVPLPLPQKVSRSSFRAGRLRMVSQEIQPAEGPDALVPLNSPARRRTQPDPEPRAPRFTMTSRFLRVQVQDSVSLTLAGHAAQVTGYDWTRLPDGHMIVVTGSRDGTVRRWDISSITPGTGEGAEQSRVALHRIVSVPLEDGTPAGLTIAEGDDVALWNLRTGDFIGNLFIGNLEGYSVPACALGVARPRDRPPIAVTFDAFQAMRIWSLPDGRQTAGFHDDQIRWPSDAACACLPDGACVAVTTGHGRRSVVWDLATGRIRNVLAGHKGWSACVTCAEGPGLWPLALTAGHDNRVNVWNLHHGRRHHRFGIVPPWTFLVRPSAGRAHSVRAVTLDSGRLLALVATDSGTVRALESRRFPFGARRSGTVTADAVGTAVLSTGRAVVVTATNDGIVRIWKPEALTRRADNRIPLCEINIEVPVSDITFVDDDTIVMATPNGLTAVRLNARLLYSYVSSLKPEQFEEIVAHVGS